MIRKHSAKVPRGVLAYLNKHHPNWKKGYFWRQYLPILDNENDLVKRFREAAGKPNGSVVIHTCREGVERHNDCMDRSCHLFIIRCNSKNAVFYDEAGKIKLKRGLHLSFNDYHLHGVSVENPALLVMVSVSNDF